MSIYCIEYMYVPYVTYAYTYTHIFIFIQIHCKPRPARETGVKRVFSAGNARDAARSATYMYWGRIRRGILRNPRKVSPDGTDAPTQRGIRPLGVGTSPYVDTARIQPGICPGTLQNVMIRDPGISLNAYKTLHFLIIQTFCVPIR